MARVNHRSKTIIYKKKAEVTNIYHYHDDRKIYNINGNPVQPSSFLKKIIVLSILGLMVLIVIWHCGIFSIVQTYWNTIEPVLAVLGWVVDLLKFVGHIIKIGSGLLCSGFT